MRKAARGPTDADAASRLRHVQPKLGEAPPPECTALRVRLAIDTIRHAHSSRHHGPRTLAYHYYTSETHEIHSSKQYHKDLQQKLRSAAHHPIAMKTNS